MKRIFKVLVPKQSLGTSVFFKSGQAPPRPSLLRTFGQGRRYDLAHIFLFSIMAILSNSDSYRKIHLFIEAHREKLNEHFGLDREKAPAYTTIRNIILNTSGSELERIFREYSGVPAEEKAGETFIHCDGKNLRGSFDNINDIKSLQILSAFVGDCGISASPCPFRSEQDCLYRTLSRHRADRHGSLPMPTGCRPF